MKYILIIWWTLNGSANAITTAEFNSRAHCENAMTRLQLDKGYSERWRHKCLPKGIDAEVKEQRK